MASKYLSHCNRDCTRLLRETTAISKQRIARINMENKSENMEKKKRRRDGRRTHTQIQNEEQKLENSDAENLYKKSENNLEDR